ncbi:MAG TPA: cell division protein ZapA [Massilibacterium sp.]|nr:cell division protein ZapA [Massilibacterium sp.]
MCKEPEKVKINVEIYGHKYTVVGKENPEHIRRVANIVDYKMHELKDRNPFLDLQKLAVLTAVNLADEACKLENKIKQLEKQLKEIEEENKND